MRYKYVGPEGINPAVIGRVWVGRLMDESDFLDTIQFLLWKERGMLVPADPAPQPTTHTES